MDYEQIKKDFEARRKKFLAKRDYQTYEKRRDLEPTGNEPPPDVYGQKSFGKALEEQLQKENLAYIYKATRTPEEEEQFRKNIEAARRQFSISEEYKIMGEQRALAISNGWYFGDGNKYFHANLRDEPIVRDDITDIKIALGNSEDVNDFIEEI